MLKKSTILLTLLPVLVLNIRIFAQQPNTRETLDYFDMSLDELMEIPVVTAASRLPQKSIEQSSPVTIITSKDIHYSGLTSIPEILQFFCGIDVLQIDRRRYAIGIHGLHETLSDRTTLLINGRPADNPFYGGPHFQALPFMVEDIERIEIVRGPASAAWGANALTGVVNIVTKKPADVPGGMVKTTITEFGDSYTYLRWAEKEPTLSWKISVGYEDIKSSKDTIDGTADFVISNPTVAPLIGFSTFEARDFARNSRIDTEIFFDITETTKLSTGIGYTHIEAGDYELGGYFPGKNIREDDVRTYMKLDHNFDNGNSGYLQWAGEFWNMNWPMAAIFSMQRHELETQYNFSLKEGHKSCIGGSFRWDHVNSSVDTAQQIHIDDKPLDEYNVGLFAIDRWKLTDQWELETQLRGDYYTPTGFDWSGRLTGFYKRYKDSKDVLRFSAAKAFSAPLSELRESSISTLPMGPIYLLNATPPRSLENEQIYSLEAGYTTKLSESLSLRVDTFYQKFDKIIAFHRTTNLLGQMFVTSYNFDGAEGWGSELEMSLDKIWGKVSGWYSYNGFKQQKSEQDFLAFMPAKHKAGVRYRYRIRPDWMFNVNYAYTDTTPGHHPMAGENSVNVLHRLDLNVAKTFNDGNGEIMVGVRDLLDKTHDPVRESSTYTAHEVPGRTFFVSLLLKF